MASIVQLGHKVLRQRASEVPVDEITSSRIQKIIHDMKEALDGEPDGAALAAPQIGVPLRIFVLATKVFGPESQHEAASKDPHLVFINPVITKLSRRRARMEEGCLSVRGRYGRITRHTNATVHAYDEYGQPFTRGAGGLLAEAFQHECEHLEGKLFIDAADEVWEVEDAKKTGESEKGTGDRH